MKNPGLGNLSKRLAQKPADEAPRPVTASTENSGRTAGEGDKRRGSQPDGRKGVLLRLNPRAWLALKSLAAEQTLAREEIFTMQSALEEALNDYFEKHGQSRIA